MSDITLASMLVLLAVAIILALFVRSRAKEGAGVFEITDKDKAALNEVRRELGVRRLLARATGSLGGTLFVIGVIISFTNKADQFVSVAVIAIGLLLGFCTALLVKSSK